MCSDVNGFRSVALMCLVGLFSLLAHISTAATGDLRLVEAVKNRDAGAVPILLARGVDVNARQPDGATALLWAAQWDAASVADALIRAGADVNAANDYGVTPLSLACTNGSVTMAETLLKAGANPNATLPTGETVLMTAARTGSPALVNMLLDRGADVTATESVKGQTVLMWAVSERHGAVMRVLIERGASVHARSTSGFTPLLFAAREGDLDAVRLLLAHGGNVNQADADGYTPLLVSIIRGHAALAEYLLDQGADPNADVPGFTALHWAAGTWDTMQSRDYQVESGEWSTLRGLPRESKLPVVKALVGHGANVNARTKKAPPRFGWSHFRRNYVIGATPFYLAAMAGDVEVMQFLVTSGADRLVAASDNTTPLMVAAGIARIDQETRVSERAQLEATKLVMKLLLEAGGDINAANDEGNTVLHAAAIAGLDTVTEFLVSAGAALNSRNKRGETPLKITMGGVNQGGEVLLRQSTGALLRKLGGVL